MKEISFLTEGGMERNDSMASLQTTV